MFSKTGGQNSLIFCMQPRIEILRIHFCPVLPKFCYVLTYRGKWGAKMVKNTFFDKNYLLTLFWFKKWGILMENG